MRWRTGREVLKSPRAAAIDSVASAEAFVGKKEFVKIPTCGVVAGGRKKRDGVDKPVSCPFALSRLPVFSFPFDRTRWRGAIFGN